MLIGLTGANAAGKGEVASFLGSRGLRIHSLSDVVREEALARGLGTAREHLILVGNELRRRWGPGVLAERILPRLAGRDVVDSIRNPAEVEVLRRLEGFVLVAVDAPEEVRFERLLRRNRPGDPRTLEEFRLRERQENSRDPDAQQLLATFRLADRVLRNDGSLVDLRASIEEVLAAIAAGGRSAP